MFPVNGTLAIDEEGDLALLSVDMPLERARTSELASDLLILGDYAQAAVLSVALLVTHSMGPEGVAPFIYFQF